MANARRRLPLRAGCIRDYVAEPILANVQAPRLGPIEVLVRIQSASLNRSI